MTPSRLHLSLIVAVGLSASILAARQSPNDAAAAGEALFFGKAGCASCHEVNGRGGIAGPDLSGAGQTSPEVLRAKILNPNAPAQTPPGGRGGPLTIVAKMKDGREIQGVRRSEDTFTLQIVDASGQLHLLEKLNLADVRRENRSLMPGDYASRLTATELQNVIAYLSVLKGRDAAKAAVASAGMAGGVTYERLRKSDAEPQNWMHYWGNYQGTHYSALKDITAKNVSNLQAKWSLSLGGTSSLEVQPLVVDGVMYTSGQAGTVLALDARTGRQI